MDRALCLLWPGCWRAEEAAVLVAVLCLLAAPYLLGHVKEAFVPSPVAASPVTEEAFTEFYRQQGIEPRVAATVFRYFLEVRALPVPILPGDDLQWDFGLSDEEREQAYTDLVRRLEKQVAAAEGAPQLGNIDGLVHSLDRLPALQTERTRSVLPDPSARRVA